MMLRRRRTRRRGWRVPAPAFSFFQNFTVIVLKEEAATEVSWKQPPMDASFQFCMRIRNTCPDQFFVLCGMSRGGWWSAYWATLDSEAAVIRWRRRRRRRRRKRRRRRRRRKTTMHIK